MLFSSHVYKLHLWLRTITLGYWQAAYHKKQIDWVRCISQQYVSEEDFDIVFV